MARTKGLDSARTDRAAAFAVGLLTRVIREFPGAYGSELPDPAYENYLRD